MLHLITYPQGRTKRVKRALNSFILKRIYFYYNLIYRRKDYAAK